MPDENCIGNGIYYYTRNVPNIKHEESLSRIYCPICNTISTFIPKKRYSGFQMFFIHCCVFEESELFIACGRCNFGAGSDILKRCPCSIVLINEYHFCPICGRKRNKRDDEFLRFPSEDFE